jgi:phosphoglycolate phosphatase-like HAD superfamily hydrolase
MVGDSPVDVRTGRAAGVLTVGVSYGLDPEGLRAERPDALLDDLRGLADVLRVPRTLRL